MTWLNQNPRHKHISVSPCLSHTHTHRAQTQVLLMYRCVAHTCGLQAVPTCQSRNTESKDLVCISSSSLHSCPVMHIHICLSVSLCVVVFLCYSCAVHLFLHPSLTLILLLPFLPLVILLCSSSFLTKPTKSGSESSGLLLNRGNGQQMCLSLPGKQDAHMSTLTDKQTLVMPGAVCRWKLVSNITVKWVSRPTCSRPAQSSWRIKQSANTMTDSWSSSVNDIMDVLKELDKPYC